MGSIDDTPRRVALLARKPLLRNSRVFKQARTLSAAGYEVVVIGIQTGDAAEWERRDGYTLWRLRLSPVHLLIREAIKARLSPVNAAPTASDAVRSSDARFNKRWLRRMLLPLAFSLRSFEYYLKAYRGVAGRLGRPDIVHANDLDTLLVGLLLARRFRAPLIYDAQELYPDIHTFAGWFRRILVLQERLLIKAPDRVIAVNPAIASVIERRYRRRVDAVVLNAAPYADLHAWDGSTLRSTLGLGDDATVLVYSGGVLDHRGIARAVLALEHLPRAVLAILGDGPAREAIESLAARRGLGERVRFLDWIPHDEVPGFIASADVGLVPYENVGTNHYLCSPSKLFHYLQAELPIACSDFPFLRELVVGHGVGATFDPSDERSIARAVRSLVEDRAANESVRRRVSVVKREYSWEAQEPVLLSIYGTLTRRA